MTRALARLLAFLALVVLGVLQWARLLDPEPLARAVWPVAFAVVGALALPRTARLPTRAQRIAAPVVLGLVLLVACLPASGIPLALLDPRSWGDLTRGIGQGMQALPAMRIPYRGVEEWSRSTLLLIGDLIAVVATLLAFRPRPGRFPGDPAIAAVALGFLFGVPAVSLQTGPQWLAGVVFAALLIVFLRAERIGRETLRWAIASGGIGLLVALVLAPRVDADRPLLDYEAIAQSVSKADGSRFDWSQTYGPLDWPRTGRELLRIRSRRTVYWKATNLTEFDGVRWKTDDTGWSPRVDRSEIPGDHPEWTSNIRVTLRGLRTTQVVGAGTTLSVTDSPRDVQEVGPGRFETVGDPLVSGQAYRAQVYVPTPTRRALENAPTELPPTTRAYLSMLLPTAAGGPAPVGGFGRRAARIQFAAFADDDRSPTLLQAQGAVTDSGSDALASSGYARAWALAQRLRAQSTTPADYVRRVQAYLRDGFGYTETPEPARLPLESFLFDTKAGYCQQFSGAMALLLRMGGVPARVAAGFAPGSRDEKTGEMVVRDVDAHAWVEAYFPTLGWVTFDPTPPESPARGRAAEQQAAAADLGGGADSGAAAASGGVGALGNTLNGGSASTDTGGGTPWTLVAGGGALILLLAGGLLAFLLRRTPATPDAQVAELHRALRRSGRRVTPDTTLHSLVGRFAGTPAEGYLRQLADTRFAGRAVPPTRAQRAGLRRALGVGMGPLERVRLWWAVPPRPPGAGGP